MIIQIDKSSSIPIYRQIESQIKKKIVNQEMLVGEKLDSENELSSMLNISPMTVRQAIQNLVNEGYVYRQRGKGTFVASQDPFEKDISRLTGFTENMEKRGVVPGSKLIRYEYINPDNSITESLKLDPRLKVLHFEILKLANNKPVGIHDTYLPPYIEITKSELEHTTSLYKIFEMKGINISYCLDKLEAIEVKEKEANLLNLPIGSPLLRNKRISFSNTDVPLEVVFGFYVPGFYEYKIKLKR